MSSNRERGLQYAAQVKEKKNERRERRPNNFSMTTPKPGPPSYDFVNNQRKEIDDTAEKTESLREEEKTIASDKERDIVDKNSFNNGTKTGRAPASRFISKSQQHEVSELKSSFRKLWTTVDHINIPLKFYDKKSSFVPNGIMLFHILFHMEETLDGNEDLRWRSPKYFSLPVRVYYAVIFFVQILRAKEQSGKISKGEGSWLRAFFRRFKDVNLPIAGPLVPFFTNIVTVLPNDDQFQYVYPTMLKKGTYSIGVDDNSRRGPRVRSTHFLVPSVPMIASLLKDFCVDRTLGDEKFDDDGNYVPFSLTTGGVFAGVTFPVNAGNDQHIAQFLANPVMMKPIPESKDRLLEIHGHWRTSGVRDIPDIPTNVAYDPEDAAGWTMMSDDFDWLDRCVNMAEIQSKYFSDGTNMSAIPTTGGNSALITAHIQLDSHTTAPTTTNTWFMKKYSKMKSTFTSSASELELDDIYEAACSLTNATLTWNVDGHPIGSVENETRDGPYFTNNKVNYELDHNESVGTGIYSTLQTMFYEARTT